MKRNEISHVGSYIDEDLVFTKKQLQSRYWTPTLIKKFLKIADGTDVCGYSGWPIYQYAKERVLKIEQSDEFKQVFSLSIKRRKKSQEVIYLLIKEGRLDTDDFEYYV